MRQETASNTWRHHNKHSHRPWRHPHRRLRRLRIICVVAQDGCKIKPANCQDGIYLGTLTSLAKENNIFLLSFFPYTNTCIVDPVAAVSRWHYSGVGGTRTAASVTCIAQ